MDKQIIASLGLDTSTIRDMGSYYIVEEDIAFDIDSLFCYQPKARQARHTTLIQVPYENFISLSTYNMPTSGPDNWLDALLEAVQIWNSMGQTSVRIIYISGGPSNVVVRMDHLPSGTAAVANLPRNGAPGEMIRINYWSSYGSEEPFEHRQKVRNLVHEIGHIIGLKHTNYLSLGETGILISGTPQTDNSSVMNGGTAELPWAGFSEYDIIAVRRIYPQW